MAYLGAFRLGDEVPLLVVCTDANSVATLPANPPVVTIYSAAGRPVTSKAMPILDRGATTGLFQLRQFLNSMFATGHHRVVYRYQLGAYQGFAEDGFDIVSGGHSDGHITSLLYYDRPHAKFILQGCDAGIISFGKNPRLG